MKKLNHPIGLAFLLTATAALSACGGSKGVAFWSSFGNAYTSALDEMCAKVTKKTGIEIAHESKGGYPEIRRQMVSAMANGDYPSLAIGYPDHIVSYLEHDILTPLDKYFTAKEKSDYFEEYLSENVFYDNSGKGVQRLYGVPFNKSTEILGYNGIFVDYCEEKHPGLGTLPTTWQEWDARGDDYINAYKELVGKKLYGVLKADGHAEDFAFAKSGNKSLLLDFTDVQLEGKNANSYLMSYDATDNAFITFVRQWGAQYTELPDSEAKKPAGRRVGKVKFTGSGNIEKVVDMFEFFRDLHERRIFCTPGYIGGDYSSKGFKANRCMFMICSSGGLSHNTTEKEYRFSVAPVPYYDNGVDVNKYVIAQGANICVTDKGDPEKSIKILKELTKGDIQADWCLETGYFPGSESAYKTKKYQDFLNSTDTSRPLRTVYREAAKVNSNVYKDDNWNCFVDPAFVGSAILREKLTGLLKDAFELKDPTEAKYKKILTDLKNLSDLKLGTISWDK